jgi:hypothetical protein
MFWRTPLLRRSLFPLRSSIRSFSQGISHGKEGFKLVKEAETEACALPNILPPSDFPFTYKPMEMFEEQLGNLV